jgi:hypothetical protein
MHEVPTDSRPDRQAFIGPKNLDPFGFGKFFSEIMELLAMIN